MTAPSKWECPGSDGGAFVICAKDGHGKRRTIAHVYDVANADLIIRAVKSHEDMIHALNSFIMAFETPSSIGEEARWSSGKHEARKQALTKAREALRSATQP